MDTSYLTQQVTSIIGQLHNLFDEIGVPHHERDSRESELFASLSETLHNHLKQVNGEKTEIVDECQRIMTTIQQMEKSLDNAHANPHYAPIQDALSITYPLIECLKTLKEKHRQISKLHKERFEQVKQLVQALESYSSHLEPSFVSIKLPPIASDGSCPPTFDLSPAYIESVDKEFTRVYDEYNRRLALVQQLGQEIVNLWAELGIPQAQTDSTIVKNWRDAPEQLGLHRDDVEKLQSRREKLHEEKRSREKRMSQLRAEVESLWDRLGADEQERKAFLAQTRGCGLRTINDLEDELTRLNELKRQNLHIFVEDARNKLQSMWDELYFSEEEAVEFTPMFSDIYSDALLSAHENEIARLEVLREQRGPIISLVAKHRSIVKDREDLSAASQDASRLMANKGKGERRDPGKLLREEKMRKRIARELPKVEQELRNLLESFEDEYGRPFLVFGERYLDELAESKAPPPRSKTPNGLPPRAKTPNNPPPKQAPKSAPSSASTVRGASAREAPRAKTPGLGSVRSHPFAAVAASRPTPSSTASNKSPSRIPARVPLGQRADAGNSPERQTARLNAALNGNQTLRGKPGALMAPPPKMRDLQQAMMPPTPVTDMSSDDLSRSGSVVRHVAPEDPYSDPEAMNRTYRQPPYNNARPPSQEYRPASRDVMPPPPRPVHGYAPSSTSSVTSSYQHNGPSTASSIRVTSNDSTAVSGSENWETYGSDEENEEAFAPPPPHHTGHQNSEEMYYARLKSASAKRAHAGDGHAGGKKLKCLRGVGEALVEGASVGASQDGWEDEELGETY